MDKIDILMATYNGENYIREQLDSIINQSYTDWKLYISDDCSTDRTLSIIKEYMNRDSRISLVPCRKNGNARDNFMYLLNFSNSRYIMFCDQDDVWLKDKVKNAYGSIKRLENGDIRTPSLIFSDLYVVDKDLQMLSDSYFKYQNLKTNFNFEKILIQNSITGCTMIFNESLKDITLKTSNIENIIMHDWWMALISSCFGKINVVDKIDIKYRQHGNNSVGAKNTNSISYIISKVLNISEIKNDIRKTQIQAKCFYENFKNVNNLTKEQEQFLLFAKSFGECMDKGKINRLYFYKKNRIKKNSILKTIGWYVGG